MTENRTKQIKMPARKRPAVSESILIYDGDCGFCRKSLALLRRLVAAMPAVEASQSYDYASHGLTETEVNSRIYWLPSRASGRDESLGGHRAIAMVFKLQPSLWQRGVGFALTAPLLDNLAALGYRVIAKNRGKLSRLVGRSSNCDLNDAGQRSKRQEGHTD